MHGFKATELLATKISGMLRQAFLEPAETHFAIAIVFLLENKSLLSSCVYNHERVPARICDT